jgi:hypothetical protein
MDAFRKTRLAAATLALILTAAVVPQVASADTFGFGATTASGHRHCHWEWHHHHKVQVCHWR